MSNIGYTEDETDSEIAAATSAASASASASAASASASAASASATAAAAGKVPLHSAPFTSLSSIPSTAWTAGLYRRIEVFLRISAGTFDNIKIAMSGASGTDYYTSNLLIATAASVPYAALTAWELNTASFSSPPCSLKMDVDLVTGGSGRSMRAHLAGNTGQGSISSGICLDATSPVTGITVTLPGACSGYLEILGYP